MMTAHPRKIDIASDTEEALRCALQQAVMELEEAANVIRMKLELSGTADIFAKAAQRKRELLEAVHVH